jgi:hypothetical protein
MLSFAGSSFAGSIVEIASFKLVLENHPHGRPGTFSMNGIADVQQSVSLISELSRNMGCTGSSVHCEHILKIFMPALRNAPNSSEPLYKRAIHFDFHDVDNLRSFFVSLITLINAEYSEHLFLQIPPKHRVYLEDVASYSELAVAFPDAIEDLREAGNCRALGRWTASVMHLMRALEVGLTYLASNTGVTHEDNWNSTLNLIEKKLREVRKNIDGRQAEQWAAEAGTHLRFIKNAFRNYAMHPLARYDEDDAVSIFDNTVVFLNHLSKRK